MRQTANQALGVPLIPLLPCTLITATGQVMQQQAERSGQGRRRRRSDCKVHVKSRHQFAAAGAAGSRGTTGNECCLIIKTNVEMGKDASHAEVTAGGRLTMQATNRHKHAIVEGMKASSLSAGLLIPCPSISLFASAFLPAFMP